MRRDYGGITVQLPGTVTIFDLDARRPVYHSAPYERARDCPDSWERRTLCGVLVHRHVYETDAAEHHGVGVPARHAVRFARPCRRCWPELLGSTLELLAGRLT